VLVPGTGPGLLAHHQLVVRRLSDKVVQHLQEELLDPKFTQPTLQMEGCILAEMLETMAAEEDLDTMEAAAEQILVPLETQEEVVVR
jgi:hypothetical protein